MGSLNIPAGALVYLDTNAVIYSIETDTKWWPIPEASELNRLRRYEILVGFTAANDLVA